MKKTLLVLTSILIFGCANNSSEDKNKTIQSFQQSMEFTNKASMLINEHGGAFKEIDKEIVAEFIQLQKKALQYSKEVDINVLNNRYQGFGNKYDELFIEGLNKLIEGYNENKTEKYIAGQRLLNEWGNWYSQNLQKIKSR